MSWLDNVVVQADLAIHCSHMPGDTISHGEKHINFCPFIIEYKIQSTLVISKSKGLTEIHRDVRTSTYQICRIEERINRTTTFQMCDCVI